MRGWTSWHSAGEVPSVLVGGTDLSCHYDVGGTGVRSRFLARARYEDSLLSS